MSNIHDEIFTYEKGLVPESCCRIFRRKYNFDTFLYRLKYQCVYHILRTHKPPAKEQVVTGRVCFLLWLLLLSIAREQPAHNMMNDPFYSTLPLVSSLVYLII